MPTTLTMSTKIKLQIKNRWTGNVLFEYESESWREAVLKAIESGADLSRANLSGADLSGADLSGADLSGADLSGADLSGAKDIKWLEETFEWSEEGLIAYKTFGSEYQPNQKWRIEAGSIIEENTNPNPTNDCGCGINVGTLQWVQNHYGKDQIWKLLIRWKWLPGVVIPYHSDGKIRASKVEIVEKINQ